MANQKIDSIKLSGSTEIYDIDLPSTATPNITRLTTSGLTVNGDLSVSGNIALIHGTGSVTLSGDVANINGTTSVNITGSVISMSSQGRTDIHADTLLNLSANNRILITASNPTTTANTLLNLAATNINLSPYNKVMFNLSTTVSTMVRKHVIALETNEFIDSKSPCISLVNYITDSTSVNGRIGITNQNGIGLLKIYNGSAGTDTYLTISDNYVNMGVTDSTRYNTFAYFSEKNFNLTLSQHLLDDNADPFIRIGSNLSNFSIDFPSDQTDITIDPHNLTLNRITPKITTSTGHLIAYPACGYTQSNDSYVIPSKSDLKCTQGSGGAIAALTTSTLTRSSTKLSGNSKGTVYHIFGFEQGNTGENPGELRVTTDSSSTASYATVIVASNDNSWHGDSYISLTVTVPANIEYYLWGKNIGSIRYFRNFL